MTTVAYARELLCRSVAEKKRKPFLKPKPVAKERPQLRVITKPDVIAVGKKQPNVHSALRPVTSPLKFTRTGSPLKFSRRERAPSITSQPDTTMASNLKSSSRLENTSGRMLESPGLEIELHEILFAGKNPSNNFSSTINQLNGESGIIPLV